MSEPLARVSTTREFNVVVVTVEGDLDIAGADRAQAAITEALDHGPAVVVDLTGVGFVDSTGMRAVIEARRRSRAEGTPLVLACDTESAAWRLLELTGTRGFFEVRRTRGDAIALAAGAEPA